MVETSDEERRRLRFIEAREESGLTQEQAALRLGKSTASVSRKERGEQPVSLADVIAMDAIAAEEQRARLGAVTDPFAFRHDGGMVVREPNKNMARLVWLRDALGQVKEQMIAFDREMLRLGADDFEADHVREGAQAFLESLYDYEPIDVKKELELFLYAGLRTWVATRIERRQASPAVPGGAKFELDHAQKAERPSTRRKPKDAG